MTRRSASQRARHQEFREAVLAVGYCRVCGREPHDPHHVVYEQECKKRNIDRWDPRNGMAVCRTCHNAHHNRNRAIPLSLLTESNLAFAFEHMGEYAHDYLTRRYSGTDELLVVWREKFLEAA